MKKSKLFIVVLILNSTFIIQSSAFSQNTADSPFGFIINPSPYAGLDSSLNAMSALGAKWIRLSGINGIVWDKIEPTSGNYTWTNTDNIISKCYTKGINILATVGVANVAHKAVFGYLPSDTNAYITFLKNTVERYDGDGINDAPGSPVVDVWQVGNEIDIPQVWSDSLKNYAELMKISYGAIKKANPNARVAIAGVASNFTKYSQVLRYLHGNICFDVFDFHWHATAGGNYKVHKTGNPGVNYYFDQYVSEIRNLLDSIGYKNTEIWITEMSISDINPLGQTEKLQAQDLLKRYVYSLRKGINVICWGTLYENNGFGGISGNGNYFNTQGVINNPLNDGVSSRKLAYYTYKKMVEILDGSDWNNIQPIQESNSTYIYKFTKNENSVYVAWNDSNVTQTISIPGITANQVITTAAVPKYISGSQVTDYASAFNTNTVAVSNNTLTLTLNSLPVFIESHITTSPENNVENVSREFFIYPNPSGNTISFQLPVSGLELRVFDVPGNIVFEKTLNSKHETLNLNLPNGMYFYQVKDNKQVNYSGKLIIQKK